MIEGALDILSCTSLMALAQQSNLPAGIHAAVIACILLEIYNACQCFALQGVLAGVRCPLPCPYLMYTICNLVLCLLYLKVVDDTPAKLVEWKGKLRGARAVIDFLVFVLRVSLWVGYNAVSSVFLVKNIYNLLHGVSLAERAYGVKCYPQKDTLFFGYVPSNIWCVVHMCTSVCIYMCTRMF